jgi:hypothetical protein
MKLLGRLQFVMAMWALSASPIAQLITQVTVTEADVELWVAALRQIQQEQRQELALLNETLPSAEFRDYLSNERREREPVLVDEALKRNESTVSIPSRVQLTVELVDAKSVKDVGSRFDIDIIGRRFGQQNRRLVRLSLPVFSKDGTRALVFSWTAGGFDKLEGRAYVFERRQREWIVVDYLYLWIT